MSETRKPQRLLEYILFIVLALVLLWCSISWVEIASKNLDANPTHSSHNIFIKLINMYQE